MVIFSFSTISVLCRNELSKNTRRTVLLIAQQKRFAQNQEKMNTIYKSKEAKKLRTFFLYRYFEYVKNYDKILEKKFPAAMSAYRVLVVGLKDFYSDFKTFIKIRKILSASPNKFQALNRREIELYDQMPKDMLKVAPVLLISALPFTNYVIFPLAFMFPRQLLSSHFWSLEQKSQFGLLDITKRLKNNRPVFRCLQAQLACIDDKVLKSKWGIVLGKLGSGVQPATAEILDCRALFSASPYHLYYLKPNHVKHLLKMQDMHTGPFKKARLEEKGLLICEMDRAILREGGAHNLPSEALRKACFIRGLNPTNVCEKDLVDWLNKWITISKSVDKSNISLLLHSPILLGYNMPSNWRLIYLKQIHV